MTNGLFPHYWTQVAFLRVPLVVFALIVELPPMFFKLRKAEGLQRALRARKTACIPHQTGMCSHGTSRALHHPRTGKTSRMDECVLVDL